MSDRFTFMLGGNDREPRPGGAERPVLAPSLLRCRFPASASHRRHYGTSGWKPPNGAADCSTSRSSLAAIRRQGPAGKSLELGHSG
jgi:hypothetical protein